MKIQVKGEYFNSIATYLVVAILIRQDENPETSYHVVDDYGRLVLIDTANVIAIVDGAMEPDLVFKDLGNKTYNILPIDISYPGFFEQFFDNDDKARTVFFNRFPELKELVKW